MGENSKIEWCDHTWNPWIGCDKVSPACDHCYAERVGARMQVKWGAKEPRKLTSVSNWGEPKRWNRRADTNGRRERVFCASLADVFDNKVPDEWRTRLFALIHETPHLDWLLLTKRIGNVDAMLPPDRSPLSWGCGWSNVWLGISVVTQAEAERDVPKLLALPAAKHFLSCEPLLGPITLDVNWIDNVQENLHAVLDWVIVGGESGPQARPMHPEWARDLCEQCKRAQIPFFFKQHGEWAPGSGDFGQGAFKTAAIAFDGRIAPGGYDVCDYPPGADSSDRWAMVHRSGKKAAGSLLDGIAHKAMPG